LPAEAGIPDAAAAILAPFCPTLCQGTAISAKNACTTSSGLNCPRNPRASPLHHCARQHYEELEAGGHFTRPVEEQVLTRFHDCGDLHQGLTYRMY
jgi:hypothetical protein